MILFYLCSIAVVLLTLPTLTPQKATLPAIEIVGAATLLAIAAATGPKLSRPPARWVLVLASLTLIAIVGVDFSRLTLDAFDWSNRFEALAAIKNLPPTFQVRYESVQIKVLARTMSPAFVLVGLAIVAYATPILPRWRYPLVVASMIVLGAWVILAWPRPKIDVLLIQEDACHDLLSGRSPYATDHPRIPWKRGEDAPITRSPAGPFMRSFPYPPMSILVTLPGYLLGDIRWSLLGASIGASILMVLIGRKLGLPAGNPAELAAVAVLVGPLALPMLIDAYTEPFLLLAVVGFVLARLDRSPIAEGLCLATIVGMKQYGFLVAIPLMWSGQSSFRSLLWAGAALLVVNLPFLIWNPSAFKLGLIDELAQAPVRSICLPAFLEKFYRIRIPPEYAIFGFFGSTIVLVSVVYRARGHLAPSVAGAAAVVMTFFFLGRVGHLHYFHFCRNLMWLAIFLAIATIERRQKQKIASPRV
jgi:hypothetical protein